ncbi:hypothetical protein PLICRDRAFT_495843 [Plicaturopsis crispa FD-325 SS-3]|nr:hypothetical protein PLICRDRAFT_495843 [Plicaturopsis crispa FD-325 SS-3]
MHIDNSAHDLRLSSTIIDGTSKVVLKKKFRIPHEAFDTFINLFLSHIAFLGSIGGTSPAYAVDTGSFAVVLTMAYFVNGNAIDYLGNNPGAAHLIVHWIKDVLKTLVELHAHGIVHGNISLTNILIGDDLRAVLADAGFHTLVQSVIASGGNPFRYHTQPLEILFTDDEEVPQPTAAVDMYSLAVTVGQMFRGENPSPGKNHSASYAAWVMKLQDGRITEAELLNGVPPDIAAALSGCCNVDPMKRPSALEVLQRIENL